MTDSRNLTSKTYGNNGCTNSNPQLTSKYESKQSWGYKKQNETAMRNKYQDNSE